MEEGSDDSIGESNVILLPTVKTSEIKRSIRYLMKQAKIREMIENTPVNQVAFSPDVVEEFHDFQEQMGLRALRAHGQEAPDQA